MPTIIRLPNELTARVALAAKSAGTSADGFILEAIVEKAEQSERLQSFHEAADRRYADIEAIGKTFQWSETRRHLGERLAGKAAARPAARKLAR